MLKKNIKIAFRNGLSFQNFLKEVFQTENLTDKFNFIESTEPDFIVFGPYGIDIPPKGDYIRIGYFCENIKPDLSICDWAFGIPHENEIKNAKYKRIQWHGTSPKILLKPSTYNSKSILDSKTKFCNFIYETKVPYREIFFSKISKLKRVDAPGPSMNNMDSINSKQDFTNFYDLKREFISKYKFTIAFENDIFPGYQTEKLYDAMKVNSIPIYCGDPNVGKIFNTKSFINVADYIKINNNSLIKLLNKYCQMDFVDIQPQYYNNIYHKFKRKIKKLGRQLKVYLMLNKLDYSPVINKVKELDNDDDKYMEMLQQPWLIGNQFTTEGSSFNRWSEIFENKKNSD